MRWIKYPWLVLGKIWSLAFIFVGGGFLVPTAYLALALYPDNRDERAQIIIRACFRFYIQMIQFLGLIELEVINTEKFFTCGGKILITNHPSLLDVVILMSLIPRAQCIVKHELWNHPFLGGLMRQAGYIRNDLDPEEFIKMCKTSLDEGRCLIIFPEGSRTAPGALPHFHRGFANIATLTKAPIQLASITCHPPFLFKGEPWWHFPVQKPFFTVAARECLDAHAYLLYGQRGKDARKLVETLERYYAEQADNGRSRAGT